MPSKKLFCVEVLRKVVAGSLTYAEVAKKLGYRTGTTRTVANAIKENNLDTSHFNPYPKKSNRRELSEYLKKGVFMPNTARCRLKRSGLLGHSCKECGQTPIWNNKPLTLQIDHKDGDNTNNEIENLRLVCPNCHTQTLTYGAKNIRRIK